MTDYRYYKGKWQSPIFHQGPLVVTGASYIHKMAAAGLGMRGFDVSY